MDLRKQLRAKERGLGWLNLKLVREGYSVEERIKLLDEAERDGVTRPRKVPRFTPEERALVVLRANRMKAGGASLKQIAAALDLAKDTVERMTRGTKCPVNHRPRRQVGWKQRAQEQHHAA